MRSGVLKRRYGGQRVGRYLPAVAVWCADIGSNANQEVHHVVVAPTDGVVKGSDALIIGLAGVVHLQKTFYTAKYMRRYSQSVSY